MAVPNEILKRNTLWPEQDFAILPIEADSLDSLLELLQRIGLRKRVLHVQIERAGRLVFGAYDQFHPECVWIDAEVGEPFLADLRARGVLSRYRAGTESPS